MADQASSSTENGVKDPRIKARKYQLELCKKAMEENVIVYLGTGCGKTHIAVLLIYELGHLIRKPQRNVCVFLAPTVPLVLQQKKVIEESTDFKVRSYFGGSKRLNHWEWEKEIEEYEVFVMTPEILLQNLHHCFIKIELIALLIFDECHHAQSQSSHPYAQIMKEFYRNTSSKRPRIFGMTASPVVGKGGPNQENLPKSINSLESILDAKVYSVEDEDELERFVASPEVKFYYYGAVENTTSSYNINCAKKLEVIKGECISMLRNKTVDLCIVRNSIKLLQRLHDNLTFCLDNLGCWGATQAIRILLSSDQSDRIEMIETEGSSNGYSLADQYLTQASTVFGSDFTKDGNGSDSSRLECLEEPLVSKKLLVLVRLLSTCRPQPDRKCIIFVNRIIVARALSYILGNLKCLEFWKCHFLVGFHSGLKSMSRKNMDAVVEKFRNGELNLLIATKVGEEGLDIQTCGLVIRFDLPDTVASFIQSRGRARMPQSEYAFLVDRGNHNELSLINSFMSDEDRMNKEISCRTSREAFDDFDETIYKVGSTGASTSAGYSVSLLHHYCSKLSHDDYFNPRPEFYYVDDLNGTVCHLILPSNAPIHELVSTPQASKENAKRDACLKACKELHLLGALTDYLLPGQANEVNEGLAESKCCEDEISRELHEMLSPAALKAPWNMSEKSVRLNFYFIRFIPVPEDRSYQHFGLFVKAPLPREVGNMQLDLHLLRRRIVKTQLVPSGTIELDDTEIMQAQNFQEMFLKIILDRSDFFSDFISLGTNDSSQPSSSIFYLLLPVKLNDLADKPSIDWKVIRRCLSSAVFGTQTDGLASDSIPASDSLQLSNGPTTMRNIVNSLVFTPHSKKFYFVDEILHGTDAETYTEHYSKKSIQLLYPKQPLLKAKQLFCLRNLLCNRIQENRVKAEAQELEEHFLELPPELCTLKIIGFSKDIGSSLSLLPSIMHRMENLLLAIELKDIFSTSFPEGSEVTAERVLEALTTEKCLERFSLERLEVLGDAFLKYAVGRQLFLSNEALDEGQLTRKRSAIVNNSHLYTLATKRNLQVYIRDEFFDPCQFFPFGRPCKLICTKDTETTIHSQQECDVEDGEGTSHLKCSKGHQWLQKKTIADVVEALVGAFIVDSGFKGATAFLKWIGIAVDFNAAQVAKVCTESDSYLALNELVDTVKLENSLGYRFFHKGLLLQAFIHPSYNKHSGGCYQRLEFLGDAVLDYLITSYLYSVYPKLKPGQLTDLRSVAVNNDSFARIAVRRSFHEYLICDSDCLSEAIREFAHYIQTSTSGKGLIEGPTCPKVLGDLVESSVGAMLLDTGFNLNHVWKIMLPWFDPIISFSSLPLNPIRELQELCQCHKWKVKFSNSEKRGTFLVEAEVRVNGIEFTSSASNCSKKTATKVVAQEIFSKLQARGYKVKSKSLEEILKSSTKHEAKLIGYDETPTRVVSADSILLENFHIQFPAPAPKHNTTSNSKAINKEPNKVRYPNKHKSPSEVPRMDCGGASEEGSCGLSYKTSARSRLFETCAINYWNPPLFECCSEEGPPHLKLFTYMVTLEIKEASNTVLECFGDPCASKKAAAEHAAEGALWYLQNHGYIAKSD